MVNRFMGNFIFFTNCKYFACDRKGLQSTVFRSIKVYYLFMLQSANLVVHKPTTSGGGPG